MNENIIITATVNGTAHTWSVSPQDAREISAVLFVAGERSGNPAISNACYIFTRPNTISASIISTAPSESMSLFHKYPKSQKFLKETEEALGEKATKVVITEVKCEPKNGECARCGNAGPLSMKCDNKCGCHGFSSVADRDQFLVSELQNCVLSDLSRLVARIGLPATKSFVLDWVDSMKF